MTMSIIAGKTRSTHIAPSSPVRPTEADRARADAHAAHRAAEAARNANHRAKYSAADARALRTGVELLGGLLASPVDMSNHTPENALHNEDGAVSVPLVVEFLAGLTAGHWPHDILEMFNERRQDELVFGPADASAQHLYAWADSMQARAEHTAATPVPAPVQPALPPAVPDPAGEGKSALAAAEEFIKDAGEELAAKPAPAQEKHGLPGVPKAAPVADGSPEDTSAMLHRVLPDLPDAEVAKIAKQPAPRAGDPDTAIMPIISIADMGPARRPENGKQPAGAVGTAFVKTKFGRGQGNG